MNKTLIATFILALGASAGANAGTTIIPTMYDRGAGLIYDVDQGLTWTKDANLSLTSVYDTDGKMTWDAAKTWANNLTYAGYKDWVLPTITQLTTQFSTNLGEAVGKSITAIDGHNANYALFSYFNSFAYWSSSEYDPDIAFHFNTTNGSQGLSSKTNERFAWAVRSGDVGVAAVPVPAAAWLFLSGLIGVVGLKQRKNIA